MTALINLLIDVAGFLLEWLILRPLSWIFGTLSAKVLGLFEDIFKWFGRKMHGSQPE
ncbi:hypothetical protein V6615_16430 (plasmid) [Oscillospiraceae bacterium PP1C4]